MITHNFKDSGSLIKAVLLSDSEMQTPTCSSKAFRFIQRESSVSLEMGKKNNLDSK